FQYVCNSLGTWRIVFSSGAIRGGRRGKNRAVRWKPGHKGQNNTIIWRLPERDTLIRTSALEWEPADCRNAHGRKDGRGF
ncbi:MAG: hypothetical protein ACN6PN_25230, partial [Sphingobacterium sp.]